MPQKIRCLLTCQPVQFYFSRDILIFLGNSINQKVQPHPPQNELQFCSNYDKPGQFPLQGPFQAVDPDLVCFSPQNYAKH